MRRVETVRRVESIRVTVVGARGGTAERAPASPVLFSLVTASHPRPARGTSTRRAGRATGGHPGRARPYGAFGVGCFSISTRVSSGVNAYTSSPSAEIHHLPHITVLDVS